MSIKFFQLSEVRKGLKVMYFLFEEVDFPVLLSSPSRNNHRNWQNRATLQRLRVCCMSIKFFQLSEVRKDLKVMYFLFKKSTFPYFSPALLSFSHSTAIGATEQPPELAKSRHSPTAPRFVYEYLKITILRSP